MKNMKKVLALLLVLALALPIAACGNSDENPNTGTNLDTGGTAAPGTTEDQPENPAGAKSLSINGVSLSSFTIVYTSATPSFKRTVSRFDGLEHGQEYDFDKVTAKRLQEAFTERFGVTLDVIGDTQEKGEHEILIGSTSRAADDGFELSDNDQYTVGVSEGALCFVGGAYGSTYHSVDYFLNYLDQCTGDVDLAADFKLEGSHHLTVIGCIGDSITEGIGSSNASMYAYPEALNRILWKDCVVINYGVSGMTMRNDTNAAYMNTEITSLRFAIRGV